jgi:hypothetical protein
MVVVIVVAINCVASYIGVSYTREIEISVDNSCNTLQLYSTVLLAESCARMSKQDHTSATPPCVWL